MSNDFPSSEELDSLLNRQSVLDALKLLRGRKDPEQFAANALSRLSVVGLRRQDHGLPPTAHGYGLALREVLLEAIRSLRPDDGPPDPTAKRWRTYLLIDGYYVRAQDKPDLLDTLYLAPATLDHSLVEARDVLRVQLREWEDGSRTSLRPRSALHQLRAPIGEFIGRTEHISELVNTLRQASEHEITAISSIHGMGGIGKTELAYTVARQLEPFFPDAQIVVELRGADPAGLSPAAALLAAIRAFEPQTQPLDDMIRLQALYRSVLSGKRVLILADAARDAAQMHALMPPVGCALLITSREHFTLPGLTKRVDLNVLSEFEAEQLLLSIHPGIGQAASWLAELCGYLPLALRVSASVLANNPLSSIEQYLERLANERTRLTALRDPDDPNLDVNASLLLSYSTLDPVAQAVLCQLSVFPAPFDLTAVMAVIQLPNRKKRPDEHVQLENIVNSLIRHSLLNYNWANQRCTLHDLVRIFTATRLRNAATVRLRHARHYLQVALQVGTLSATGGEHVGSALVLFDRERIQIDAGWTWALNQRDHRSSAIDQLLIGYARATLDIGALRYDNRLQRIPWLTAGLEVARRLHDRELEQRLLNRLGWASAILGDVQAAIAYHEQSLTVARQIEDRKGEAEAYGSLGWAYHALGNVKEANTWLEQSLALLRELGNTAGEAYALSNLGWSSFSIGQLRRAVAYHEQSLAIMQMMQDQQGIASALGGLGAAYCALGNTRQGFVYHQRSLAMMMELANREGEAYALGGLAWAYFLIGDLQAAKAYHTRRAWQRCVRWEVVMVKAMPYATWGVSTALWATHSAQSTCARKR